MHKGKKKKAGNKTNPKRNEIQNKTSSNQIGQLLLKKEKKLYLKYAYQSENNEVNLSNPKLVSTVNAK